MVVSTGVVLSVKLPKVPMPATAAAAPMTAIEPTTLRAFGLSVILRMSVLMSLSSCVLCGHRVSGDRENSAGPTSGDPLAIRKEFARRRPRTRRSRAAGATRARTALRPDEGARRVPEEGLRGLTVPGGRHLAAVS